MCIPKFSHLATIALTYLYLITETCQCFFLLVDEAPLKKETLQMGKAGREH